MKVGGAFSVENSCEVSIILSFKSNLAILLVLIFALLSKLSTISNPWSIESTMKATISITKAIVGHISLLILLK